MPSRLRTAVLSLGRGSCLMVLTLPGSGFVPSEEITWPRKLVSSLKNWHLDGLNFMPLSIDNWSVLPSSAHDFGKPYIWAITLMKWVPAFLRPNGTLAHSKWPRWHTNAVLCRESGCTSHCQYEELMSRQKRNGLPCNSSRISCTTGNEKKGCCPFRLRRVDNPLLEQVADRFLYKLPVRKSQPIRLMFHRARCPSFNLEGVQLGLQINQTAPVSLPRIIIFVELVAARLLAVLDFPLAQRKQGTLPPEELLERHKGGTGSSFSTRIVLRIERPIFLGREPVFLKSTATVCWSLTTVKDGSGSVPTPKSRPYTKSGVPGSASVPKMTRWNASGCSSPPAKIRRECDFSRSGFLGGLSAMVGVRFV